MQEAGQRAGWLQVAGHPPLAFLRNYVIRGGFRDGAPGLIISAMNAYYVFLKFAKLWELEETKVTEQTVSPHRNGVTEGSGSTSRPA
jgi:hypothetical protein